MRLQRAFLPCVEVSVADVYVPILRSSSCLTSTASLVFWSGWVRFSQADLTAWSVISENRARKTCRFGFTATNTQKRNQSDSNTNRKEQLINSYWESMLTTDSTAFQQLDAFPVYHSHVFIRISQHLTWTQQNWEFASAKGVVKPLMELRLMKVLYTPALHTWMISKPMFSPSRSQSVQITRAWHCWISRSRVLWEEKNNTGRTFQATCSVISLQNDSLNTKCNVYPWRWVVAKTFCNCVSREIGQL